MTIEGYRQVNTGQSWDTIGKNVVEQLENSNTLEMRYVRVAVSYTHLTLPTNREV